MTLSSDVLDRANSMLNKPKSVPFLTQDGTIAEVRFATPTAAAECRERPDSMLAKHDLVKVLTDVNDIIEALRKMEELDEQA